MPFFLLQVVSFGQNLFWEYYIYKDVLKSFDIDKCNERFANFYRLHNLEVNRLTGQKNLSSIAI